MTTRAKKGRLPDVIIAMIVSKNPSSNLEKNLKRVNLGDIYTIDELKEFDLDSTFSARNMYELCKNALIQQNVENKTLEMQGLGNPYWFAPRVYGKTVSLVSDDNNMTSYDIQKFMKISEKEPDDLGLKQNQLIISPDLISWKMYRKPTTWDGDVEIIDSAGNSNADLPVLGFALKYGIDDINYPSLWSERMTAYAMWQSVKLGVILPTDGWSSIQTDLYEIDRNLTYGGVGIAGEFDFPILVIPKSGLFHFSFGYVFGDAKEASYKNRKLDTNYVYADGDDDYLIRYNAQLHYTFGVAIDESYLLRFGIGGTIYGAEKWHNRTDRDANGTKIIEYKKDGIETVGGISGKIEFLATNATTPFGASLQYFDEGIAGDIWLQIPIIQNALALRLSAAGFSPMFRNQRHGWEKGGYFIPMARLIVDF